MKTKQTDLFTNGLLDFIMSISIGRDQSPSQLLSLIESCNASTDGKSSNQINEFFKSLNGK